MQQARPSAANDYFFIFLKINMVCSGASLVAETAKNLPAMWETWVQSLGWEDSLEKGMATHSSTLAWEIPGQRSLVGYSPQGHRVKQY